jgi:gluconokinase
LEGILLGIYQIGLALEETTGPISEIHAGGGFARSPIWVQLLADIFQKKVTITDTIESSAWGAALLGLEVLGWEAPPGEVAVPAKRQEFMPDPQKHAIYQHNFSIFEKLYPLLQAPMAQMQDWQG